jgi:hypothetical protein
MASYSKKMLDDNLKAENPLGLARDLHRRICRSLCRVGGYEASARLLA